MNHEPISTEHKLKINYPERLLEKFDLELIAGFIKNSCEAFTMSGFAEADLNIPFELESLTSSKIKDIMSTHGSFLFYSPSANDNFINCRTGSSQVIILDNDHPTDMICVDYMSQKPKAWVLKKSDLLRDKNSTGYEQTDTSRLISSLPGEILDQNIERSQQHELEMQLKSIKEKLTKLASQFESFGQIYNLIYQSYPDLIAQGPVAYFGDNSETASGFERFVSDMESTILRKSKQLSKLKKLKPLFQAEYFKQQVVKNQEQINLLRKALIETLDSLKGYSIPRKSNGSDVTNYPTASESIKKLAQTLREIIELGNKESVLRRLVVRFFIKTMAITQRQKFVLDSNTLADEIDDLVEQYKQFLERENS